MSFPPKSAKVITQWPRTLKLEYAEHDWRPKLREEWQQDPEGYFLILADHTKKRLLVGFISTAHEPQWKVAGPHPLPIYYTIFKQMTPKIVHHAAYLGEELAKAYIAMRNGLEYVQDSEVDFDRKHTPSERDKSISTL